MSERTNRTEKSTILLERAERKREQRGMKRENETMRENQHVWCSEVFITEKMNKTNLVMENIYFWVELIKVCFDFFFEHSETPFSTNHDDQPYSWSDICTSNGETFSTKRPCVGFAWAAKSLVD